MILSYYPKAHICCCVIIHLRRKSIEIEVGRNINSSILFNKHMLCLSTADLYRDSLEKAKNINIFHPSIYCNMWNSLDF